MKLTPQQQEIVELLRDHFSRNALRVLEVWGQVLGPGLSPHCRAVAVRRGTLVAEVPDSAWMQRLQFEKPRILGELRELLGEAAPGELRFRISAPQP